MYAPAWYTYRHEVCLIVVQKIEKWDNRCDNGPGKMQITNREHFFLKDITKDHRSTYFHSDPDTRNTCTGRNADLPGSISW